MYIICIIIIGLRGGQNDENKYFTFGNFDSSSTSAMMLRGRTAIRSRASYTPRSGSISRHSDSCNYLHILFTLQRSLGILLYQGFSRPILPSKNSSLRSRCFDRGNPWLSKKVVHNFTVLRYKCANILTKTLWSG